MKIGVIREGKVPPDKRVPLVPKQLEELQALYPNIEWVVQPSKIRCHTDQEYLDLGITLQKDLSDCDVLLGVKEVPMNDLIPRKTYFYFSHTIKEQPYNKTLLKYMLANNIRMVDYETLTTAKGNRLIGFGRYAGIVGAYNGILAYGKKSGTYDLKAANQCFDRKEMEGELSKVQLGKSKIVLTGAGRVAKGALEILEALKIRQVDKEAFLNETFDEAVFVQIDSLDYNEMADGSVSKKAHFYEHPEDFRSTFMDYAKVANIFIAGHYYAAGAPYLFTREDAKSAEFNIEVVADISCDIDGPVASTIRPSTIADPIYGYNPITEKEDDIKNDGVITVMAVDNLPCELPKDASEDFGNEMMKHILPALLGEDPDKIIERATICENGALTSYYEYLHDYAYN